MRARQKGENLKGKTWAACLFHMAEYRQKKIKETLYKTFVFNPQNFSKEFIANYSEKAYKIKENEWKIVQFWQRTYRRKWMDLSFIIKNCNMATNQRRKGGVQNHLRDFAP